MLLVLISLANEGALFLVSSPSSLTDLLAHIKHVCQLALGADRHFPSTNRSDNSVVCSLTACMYYRRCCSSSHPQGPSGCDARTRAQRKLQCLSVLAAPPKPLLPVTGSSIATVRESFSALRLDVLHEG